MIDTASDQPTQPATSLEDAPSSSSGRRTAVWLAPDQLDLVASVVASADLELVCAGTASKGDGVGLADQFRCEPLRDLRSALTSEPVDLILIMAAGEFGDRTGSAGADDASALQAACRRGVRIASLDPIPSSALELSRGTWRTGSNANGPACESRLLLTPRQSPIVRNAVELLEQFGAIRTAAMECWGGANLGGVGPRLVGGLDLIEHLLGEPEQIDAAYVGPGHGQTLRALPGESLRGLTGDFTANLRLTDGRAASLAVSDQAGRPGFRISLLGSGGMLRLEDTGLLWLDPEGREIDRTDRRRQDGPEATGMSRAAESIADELRRMLTSKTSSIAPVDPVGYLSMAHAALLSARTGQPESPQVIRRLVATA